MKPLTRIFHNLSAAIAASLGRLGLFCHFLVGTLRRKIASPKSGRKVLTCPRINDFAKKSYEKSGFNYRDEIPGSKSIFNRLLIVKSFFDDFEIHGKSTCEDVLNLKNCLHKFFDGSRDFFCGEGGTTLRFWALRLSRKPGDYIIRGSPQLFQRPLDELIEIFDQLGVQFKKKSETEWALKTSGWQSSNATSNEIILNLSVHRSSQFLSGIILSSWNSEVDIRLVWRGDIVSLGYLNLTIEMVRELGMQLETNFTTREIKISKGQKLRANSYLVESDLSSCFSVAALAAINGRAEFLNFPFNSRQPDLKFLELMEMMKIPTERIRNSLIVKMAKEIQSIDVDLNNSPDLFPVLAVLCSLAVGTSILKGASQLIFKESNRLTRVSELLSLLMVKHDILTDGIKISSGPGVSKETILTYDPFPDHRLLMAAQLYVAAGYKVEIVHPEVVNKSFPEYLELVL